MGEVFLAAVAGNKPCAVVADGELGDENQDLLTVPAKDLLAEGENVGELFARVGGLVFEGVGVLVKFGF